MILREDQHFFSELMNATLPISEAKENHGEVFTRRWVVDFILDLAGYSKDEDLAYKTIVEPSCGSGAFLIAIVERLIHSAKRHQHNLEDLGCAVRAFDLIASNVENARRNVLKVLIANGVSNSVATVLIDAWISQGDYLLQDYDFNSVDFVVGNPPYVRLENVDRGIMEAYRKSCSTMRGRADIYVGFIERGLQTLKPSGTLAFICADRWMRNQYGADLREFITSKYAIQTVVSMHDVDAFEDEVSAYPAVVVLQNKIQEKISVIDVNSGFNEHEAGRVAEWVLCGKERSIENCSYEASRIDRWFEGRDLWPSGSPTQLALIAELESRFPPLQDFATGTRVGIGVATGCDQVFITNDSNLVEPERLLPLLQASDIANGKNHWSGTYLVNPWNATGLVDLEKYPRLAEYLRDNEMRLKARHIAKKRPDLWYRTIDRVHGDLSGRAKLVLPDLKAAAHPVLDDGSFYPHHNLYYVVSEKWDLRVLGGILLSDIANLFVGAYCVRMRGGTYRFQAQYLRRIRVPDIESISKSHRNLLAEAFERRDRDLATQIAFQVYGIHESFRLDKSLVA